MREKMGFGKADRLLERVAFEKRVGRAKRNAQEVRDDRYLSDDDWAFLLLDIALLTGVFAAEEFGLIHRRSKLDGELGAVLLTSGESNTDGVVIQIQVTGSEPPFEVVGATEGPEWSGDTDGLVNYAAALLAKPAWSFTARWTDCKGKRHQIADYGLTQSHCAHKAEEFAKGGVLVTPVAVSEHPSLGSALCFAHSLNKSSGKLFGGRPYEDIQDVIREGYA